MLGALFFATGLWNAAIGPFISVILSGHGLDLVTIGFISAFTALAVIVVVPLWGHLADVTVGRARSFRIGLILAGSAAIAILLPLPAFAIVASVASFWLTFAIFSALGDALATAALSSPEHQYGRVRARASLSFTIAVIAAGLLYNVAGYGAASVVSLVCSATLFVIVGRVADHTRDSGNRLSASSHHGQSAVGRFGSVSRAFAVQPRLLGLLAAFTIAYAGLQGALLFVGIRVVNLGGHASDVGLSFGLSTIGEVPGFFVANYLGRRFGLRWLTAASLIGYGVCIASWGILPTPLAINLTRLVTGFCFGSFTTARVQLVARLLPRSLQATGQGLVQAATVGVGTVMGNALGGFEYEHFGPMVFFLVAGIAATVGGFGAWRVLAGFAGSIEPGARP